MMISNPKSHEKPDFKKVYKAADEIIVCSSVMDTFPFKTKHLVHEQSDLEICTFNKAMNKFGLNIRDLGSQSALLTTLDGMYIIFYNHSESPQRKRFSILHEFGHYILGHKLHLSLDNPLYKTQEIEANCFAAQLLMPEQLLRELSKQGIIISQILIMKLFDVSKDAAQKRINSLAKTYDQWQSRKITEYDDTILCKYGTFLDSVKRDYSSCYSFFEEDYAKEIERNGWIDNRSWR